MKYFTREEFQCSCGCGFDTVDYELAEVLDDVRTFFKSPVVINSGCRCISRNHTIGGSAKSQHLYGRAADIVVKDIDAELVYNYLDKKYPDTYGVGKYNGRTHIDTRKHKARWNKTEG